VDIEASSLRLQHRYDTIRYDTKGARTNFSGAPRYGERGSASL